MTAISGNGKGTDGVLLMIDLVMGESMIPIGLPRDPMIPANDH